MKCIHLSGKPSVAQYWALESVLWGFPSSTNEALFTATELGRVENRINSFTHSSCLCWIPDGKEVLCQGPAVGLWRQLCGLLAEKGGMGPSGQKRGRAMTRGQAAVHKRPVVAPMPCPPSFSFALSLYPKGPTFPFWTWKVVSTCSKIDCH